MGTKSNISYVIFLRERNKTLFYVRVRRQIEIPALLWSHLEQKKYKYIDLSLDWSYLIPTVCRIFRV